MQNSPSDNRVYRGIPRSFAARRARKLAPDARLRDCIYYYLLGIGNRREIVRINRMRRDAKIMLRNAAAPIISIEKLADLLYRVRNPERGAWKPSWESYYLSTSKIYPAYIFSRRRNSFRENAVHDRVSRAAHFSNFLCIAG